MLHLATWRAFRGRVTWFVCIGDVTWLPPFHAIKYCFLVPTPIPLKKYYCLVPSTVLPLCSFLRRTDPF